MPTPTIPFNNSSQEVMACTRRYTYEVVRGAITEKSAALHNGTLFHAYMREVTQGDAGITMAGPFAVNRFADEKKNVPDVGQQLVLADLACQTRDKIGLSDDANVHERETFFSVEIPMEVDGQRVVIDLCGTSDLRTVTESLAVIHDYKTTSKPIDGDHVLSYMVKSQLFFYAVSLRMLAENTLAAQRSLFQHTLLKGNVGRQYIFVNIKGRGIMVPAIEAISQDTLDATQRAMFERMQLAAYLWLHPERSTKDGMFNGACFFCPFKQICALHDTAAEARAIDTWHLGFRPYNPRHYIND